MRLEQAMALIGQPWSGADTVGNLIVERLRRVPEPGEEVIVEGVPVEIEAVDGNAVTSVIVGARPIVEDGDDAR